ncbi:Uncharacterised protein [uncultured archaeon]|nr:Uncharacterised protein [uncultured archaeon]
MKFGEFEQSLAVSAAVVALIVLMDAHGSITPLFAVALFALSQAGYFSLALLRKAGMGSPGAEYLYLVVVIGAFLAGSLSLLSPSSLLPLYFVPAALCAPAAASLARGLISSG